MVGLCMLGKFFHINDRKIEGISKKKMKNEEHNTKKKKHCKQLNKNSLGNYIS